MTHRIAILGASGYTGAELVRLILSHPAMRIVALSAERKAGARMGEVFRQLAPYDLPVLQKIDEIDFDGVDLVFCALPHGVAHGFVKGLNKRVKVVDLSADFRLRDPDEYRKWYGLEHLAMELQPEVAYGIPEFYRAEIAAARITANSGCHVATGLLPLVPALRAGTLDPDSIIIDSKTGVSGAGRGLNEGSLYCEVAEGIAAYGVGGHRHMAEFDQELSLAAGRPVAVQFIPHLVPMNRGLLATIYAAGDAHAVHEALAAYYRDEPFVHLLEFGLAPATRHVRGSNMCHIGVVEGRGEGRVVIVSVLDNLIKGASGQALQCANIMLGEAETAGLKLVPMFP